VTTTSNAPDSPNAVDASPFVLTRTVNAPRDLVWRAFTERECLAQWLSPTGMTVLPEGKLDLRPGGLYHYGLRAANGFELWAKWTFREVIAPERLVYILSFSDPQGGNTRHPMAPDWPMEMLSTITLTEQGERTLITLQSQAINASASEQSAFNAGKSGMTQGWSGTFDQLDVYLADVERRSIVIERMLDFPRALVFQAYVDPQQVGHWWGPNGFSITTGRMDVRVGGVWQFMMHGPDGTDYPNKIAYTRVVPNERLEFAHGDDTMDDTGTPAHFQATVVFAGHGDKTRLTMRLQFATVEQRNITVEQYGAIEGGKQTLGRLAEFLAHAGQDIYTTRDFAFPREQVFAAWTQPELLASWWGPKGFTNTFEEFDLRPGGHWRFTMHGPDGTGYPNHSIFSDIVPPQRIVFDHVSGHHFEVNAVFTERAAGKTRLTWRMRFDTAEECAKVKAFVTTANEENMDKLQKCLETQGATRA
jgi:uncharacterized protein YndB with AHSA1/START domain